MSKHLVGDPYVNSAHSDYKPQITLKG